MCINSIDDLREEAAKMKASYAIAGIEPPPEPVLLRRVIESAVAQIRYMEDE